MLSPGDKCLLMKWTLGFHRSADVKCTDDELTNQLTFSSAEEVSTHRRTDETETGA